MSDDSTMTTRDRLTLANLGYRTLRTLSENPTLSNAMTTIAGGVPILATSIGDMAKAMGGPEGARIHGTIGGKIDINHNIDLQKAWSQIDTPENRAKLRDHFKKNERVYGAAAGATVATPLAAGAYGLLGKGTFGGTLGAGVLGSLGGAAVGAASPEIRQLVKKLSGAGGKLVDGVKGIFTKDGSMNLIEKVAFNRELRAAYETGLGHGMGKVAEGAPGELNNVSEDPTNSIGDALSTLLAKYSGGNVG